VTGDDVPILELIGIHAAYGRIDVLRGIDLVVPHHSVVALLGPNGAGKTTLLKVISGQMRATAGHVHLKGMHVNNESAADLARAGLCTIPEGRGIFPNLSVRENLTLVSYAGTSVRDIEETAYNYFPRLAERRKQLAGTLSGGEQQMLAMSRALASKPALVLLDELSMGLAPLIVKGLYESVQKIAADGISVLVVDQFAQMALSVSTYAAVMQNGRITAVGEPGDIEESLSAAYLGGAA
jgi:branched-chain amino acid transport system ATP-binding protein